MQTRSRNAYFNISTAYSMISPLCMLDKNCHSHASLIKLQTVAYARKN